MKSYCIGKPLSPDGFSQFGEDDPNSAQNDSDLEDAVALLETSVLPTLVKSLSGNETDLASEFHAKGVNVALLGLAFTTAQELGNDTVVNMLKEEIVCRALKSLLREDLRDHAMLHNFNHDTFTNLANSFVFNIFTEPADAPIWKRLEQKVEAKFRVKVGVVVNTINSSFATRLHQHLSRDLALSISSNTVPFTVNEYSVSADITKVPPFFQRDTVENFLYSELSIRERALGTNHPALVSTLIGNPKAFYFRDFHSDWRYIYKLGFFTTSR